jgi:hypothetical protein
LVLILSFRFEFGSKYEWLERSGENGEGDVSTAPRSIILISYLQGSLYYSGIIKIIVLCTVKVSEVACCKNFHLRCCLARYRSGYENG